MDNFTVVLILSLLKSIKETSLKKKKSVYYNNKEHRLLCKTAAEPCRFVLCNPEEVT